MGRVRRFAWSPDRALEPQATHRFSMRHAVSSLRQGDLQRSHWRDGFQEQRFASGVHLDPWFTLTQRCRDRNVFFCRGGDSITNEQREVPGSLRCRMLTPSSVSSPRVTNGPARGMRNGRCCGSANGHRSGSDRPACSSLKRASKWPSRLLCSAYSLHKDFLIMLLLREQNQRFAAKRRDCDQRCGSLSLRARR